MQTLTKSAENFLPRRPARKRQLGTSKRTGALTADWWIALEFLFVICGSIYLLFHEPESIDQGRCMLALIIVWLGLLPSFIYLHSSHRPSVPIFPLIGIFYATNYGLPVFAGDLQDRSQTSFLFLDDVSSTSLWLALGGIACMLLAYYAARSTLWTNIKKLRIVGNWTNTRFRLFLWTCLGAHVLYWVIPVLRETTTLSHVLDPLGFLAFGMFFFIAKDRRLGSVEFFIIWIFLFPMELVFRLATGSIAQTLLFCVYMSLISYKYLPKLSMSFVGLGAAFFLIFSPVKNYYRMITWDQERTGFSIIGAIDRAEIFFILAYDYHFGENTQIYQTDKTKTIAEMAGRISSISVFSLVVDETPIRVPYWGGETYKPLLTKWIPRVIWPNKPVDNTGQQFGHRYRLLDDLDETTSINLPWMTEMYANFGTFGVLSGMCLVGIMLSGLDRILNRSSNNPLEMIFGTIVLMSFIYQESSFSLMIGDAMLLSAVMYTMLKVALMPTALSRPI